MSHENKFVFKSNSLGKSCCPLKRRETKRSCDSSDLRQCFGTAGGVEELVLVGPAVLGGRGTSGTVELSLWRLTDQG